jgi:hypothetical protein
MFEKLRSLGFDIHCVSHAEAILSVDFPSVAEELEGVLASTSIPITEIIGGGGGEAKVTQRLRRALADRGWRKTNFLVEKQINGVRQLSQSHEVDHVRDFGDKGSVALEIEWNNKDPFYDRDLENYQRLHSDGAISVGVIVTRGRSLHEGMRGLVRRFLDDEGVNSVDELRAWRYRPTDRQKKGIEDRMAKRRQAFREAFSDAFVSDKFGEATTHWRKLEDRIQRGVGNPCPLVCIGLPDSVVEF